MINNLKQTLWKQFGASIDMLNNAIALWPQEEWTGNQRFFYTAWHCLVFLDYYLTMPPTSFSPVLPFTIKAANEIPAEALDDIVPDRMYSKKELLDYLHSSREKCKQIITGLTEEKLQERWIEDPAWGSGNYAVPEILLYNMRHVQHHTAQLNMLLRQQADSAPGWVSQAEDEL